MAKWIIRISSGLIVLAAVGTAAAWMNRPRSLSPEMTGAWSLINDQPWLLPNLDGVTIVVPDRPHLRSEVVQFLSEGPRLVAVPRRDQAVQDAPVGTDLTRVRTYSLTTNAWRLRGPPLGEKVHPRVGVVGESVAMGHGVDDDEAWPALLEEELKALGTEVEVLNGACPAASLEQMGLWCRNVAPSLELDLVLWTGVGMDNGRDPYINPGLYRQHVQACEDAVGAPVVVVLPPVSSFNVRSPELRRLFADLARVVPQPLLNPTPAFEAASQGIGDRLVVQGEAITLVDQDADRVVYEGELADGKLPAGLLSLLDEDPDLTEALFFDQQHPNEAGSRLLAEVVGQFLWDEEVLDP